MTARELTLRELQVLDGVAAGETADATGRRLHVTEDTIKTHRKRAYLKLGARSGAHAVAIAYERGVLPMARARGGTR